MARFLVRRFIHALVVVIAATLLLFCTLFAFTDPFGSTGERAVPPEVQAALAHKFGTDKPLPVQYATYLRNVVTGDLGIDFEQRRPVADLLRDSLPATVRLALVAIAIDALLGIIAGIIAAVWRYSFWDVFVTMVSTLAIGIPTFVLGVGLRSALTGEWIFPMVPRSFTVEVPWYQEVLLPALTLAIIDAAFIARLTRGSMLETLRADFVRTARAKGLPERQVIARHALRNSLLPVVTYVGVSLGVLFGGAIVTEAIFQYRGIGFLLADSIIKNNNPVIMAIVTLSVIAFVALSLIVDALYAWLDPRIRIT